MTDARGVETHIDHLQDLTGIDPNLVVALVAVPDDDGTRFAVGDVPEEGWIAETEHTVAVLLPCRNEETTIGKVVSDFRRMVPEAAIYVYDNASTDHTAEIARAAGAIVRYAPVLGKGNVVRQMFAEIDAGAYVLADGDDTYDAGAAPLMISKLRHGHLDMVVGTRVVGATSKAFPPGHRLGNQLLTGTVRWLFGPGSKDMLSGYRVFSRKYVKAFPALSQGFELETEMTVHTLELRLPFAEVPTDYRDRPEGSASKLQTIPDGLRILKFVLLLCKKHRPLRFFGSVAIVPAIMALVFAVLQRSRLQALSPDTFRLAGLTVLAAVSALAGVILDSSNSAQREIKRMSYFAAEHTSGMAEAASPGYAEVNDHAVHDVTVHA